MSILVRIQDRIQGSTMQVLTSTPQRQHSYRLPQTKDQYESFQEVTPGNFLTKWKCTSDAFSRFIHVLYLYFDNPGSSMPVTSSIMLQSCIRSTLQQSLAGTLSLGKTNSWIDVLMLQAGKHYQIYYQMIPRLIKKLSPMSSPKI